MAKAKRIANAARRPEKKYGPFAGGCGVVIWLNEVETDSGTRFFRSIQIAPRRYRNKKTGNWEDAGSLRITDVPAMILALQAAHDYASSAPLPGQPAEEEHLDDPPVTENNEKTPF